MSNELIYDFLRLLICLLPFILIQRWLHRNLQATFLLITRRQDIALALFSVLFFPGVLLHEISHLITARLVGVRTGRFSLLPRLMPDGRLRLGLVETAPSDVFREALIGIAPLVVGGAVVTYLGSHHLGLTPLIGLFNQGSWGELPRVLPTITKGSDFWIWFYLAFTISSTMMPSPSDRRAWLPLGVWISLLLGLAVFAGAGTWMLSRLAPWVNHLLSALTIIFGISLALHLILAIPSMIIRALLVRF